MPCLTLQFFFFSFFFFLFLGDKAETATCIGISARLIDRNQSIFQFLNCTSQRETARMLDLFGSKVGTCLVIDGPSLQICLDSFQKLFLELACTSPAVICCRCSPTQKATVVSLMRAHTGLRTAAIGDGGNDCSMILAASVGVGIVGLEGMQASLAADFSITQFSFILPLLLWHGRNAYKRSARLSQFVIHRGLIISIIQAVFSALFFFAAVPVYNGWLVVGYATFYTMLPVFSLVLDVDVEESKVYLYPELYRELQKGRPLSSKTFVIWIFQSVYQGGIIMMGVLALFEARFLNIVSITFTALIASELLNVALEIVTWHRLMVVAEVCSVLVYFASLFFLPAYFDLSFIFTWPLFVTPRQLSHGVAHFRWLFRSLFLSFFLLCYCVRQRVEGGIDHHCIVFATGCRQISAQQVQPFGPEQDQRELVSDFLPPLPAALQQ
jgi:phospholipid-translocating ATPase